MSRFFLFILKFFNNYSWHHFKSTLSCSWNFSCRVLQLRRASKWVRVGTHLAIPRFCLGGIVWKLQQRVANYFFRFFKSIEMVGWRTHSTKWTETGHVTQGPSSAILCVGEWGNRQTVHPPRLDTDVGSGHQGRDRPPWMYICSSRQSSGDMFGIVILKNIKII